MITTIKELINTCTDKQSCATIDFNQPEIAKLSLAVIMWHTILADGKITEKEMKHLFGFFQKEFEMTNSEITVLIDEVKENTPDIEDHIQLIEDEICSNIHAKSALLKHVNALIICDNIVDIEYVVFERIRSHLIK